MSYRAIAAALALDDLSVGERLVAFSLASYAGRDHRAWPAARTAAMRAGLSRRQYLAARGQLVERGLILIEPTGGQQGGTALMRLCFAEAGASIEREVNAGLFEAVLTRASVDGGARVLLATLAALAHEDGIVAGLSSEEICEASGLSDRTYRRARSELLGGGEISLEAAGGGRSRCNRWRVRDPRSATRQGGAAAAPRPRSTALQMPLMAAVRDLDPVYRPAAEAAERGTKAAPMAGVVESENPGRNPGVNPGQIRTTAAPETPAQTPAETPAPHARAGWESQNLKTRPPDPPKGGQSPAVPVIEEYVSDRGRRRHRRVAADPAEISLPTERDRSDWSTIREALRAALGDVTFEIWFTAYAMRAVSARDGALLIDGPAQASAWVRGRYGGLLSSLAEHVGRRLRVASDRELALLAHVETPRASPSDSAQPSCLFVSPDYKEVV